MADNKIKPTEAELEILQILWDRGPSTVRQVNDELNKKRNIVYTTSLKLMQIMASKSLLKRDTRNRTHIYEAIQTREKTQVQLLDRLMDTAFGGSAQKLVMQALGNYKAGSKELEEIKKMINEIEKNK